MAATAPYKPPRLSDGHPDLQGDWTNSSITTLERPQEFGERRALTADEAADMEAEFNWISTPKGPNDQGVYSLADVGALDALTSVMRVAGEPRSSFITSPANGRIPPARPDAAPKPATLTDEVMYANPETMPPPQKCLSTATPNSGPVMLPGGYNNNFRFVQTREALAIAIQMAGDVRIIRVGARHRTDGVRPWMGDSIAHWDKDSLVVETTNFPQAQAFYGAWEHLKVTETFTRVAADRLLYRFSVEDPTVWDQPWGGEYEFSPSKGPIEEYACHENDYTLELELDAARYGAKAP